MTINKEKHIGKVLYIVEGNKTEFNYIYKIFHDILDYSVIIKKRNQEEYLQFESSTDKNSKVYIINTETPNISSIEKNADYLNNLFSELINNYEFDIDNSAIFYIFDRDPKSNTEKDFIENLITTKNNSRDSLSNDRQGLLLLSYPSIEAFTLSNFKKDSFDIEMDLGKNLKRYLNTEKILPNNINHDTVKFATNELISAMNKIGVSFSENELDDFSYVNNSIFEYEENKFSSSGTYNLLSLLCISLIDLGIISL